VTDAAYSQPSLAESGLADPGLAPATWKNLVMLALAAFALLTPGLFSLPPVDRDEPRYATATSQMLDSHNFIDIRLQDRPRYLQPAGVYWLQAIPTALFSTPGRRAIWTFRLVSLLGAVFAVVTTGWAASRLFGRKVGLAAALMLAACLSLGFEAKIAKTDAALLAAVVTAQFALMRAYLKPDASRRNAAAFWIALGVGVLLKGPIILLVTGLTVASVALWDRRVRWLVRLRPLWGLPLMLLVAAPWYVAIGLASHGEFYRIAIGRSLMGKVAAGQQAHGAPFGYHLMAFPLTFWPASLLAVMAVPYVWRERTAPAVRFLLCWIIPSWIVFELVKTKLPHYVLPLFPAIACLTALALFSPRTPVRAWVKVLFGLFVLLWIAISALLSGLAPVALWNVLKVVDPLAAILGLATAASVIALGWSVWRNRPEQALVAVACASFFGSTAAYTVTAPRLQGFWLSPRVEALVQATRPCPQSVLVSTPYHEPSLVFLNGPFATVLAKTPVDAADRMAAAGACGMALVGDKQRPDFLARAAVEGLPLRPLGQLQGRDYADNRNLTLTLYARGAPRPVVTTPRP
jgi:4-amino-4-deoxy-L-arabinose transferase-like glycosyltransferase